MTAIVLGFITSLVYGFADFAGAIAAKKIKPITVTFVAGCSGLVLLCFFSIYLGANFSSEGLLWGVLGGIASAFGIACLYASLALGPISIVSPLGAVISAIVPMIVGFAQGDRFSALGFVALAVILIAVVLVGFVPGDDVRLPSVRAIWFSVGAGVGIGFVMIAMDAFPRNSGLAALITLRTVAITLLGAFVLISYLRTRGTAATREPIGIKWWLLVSATGFLDASANVTFLLATRVGSLSVVSVLTALYPLGTIILARILLKEKIARTQQLGILLALAASAVLAIA
ncbi:DMT family transporter [Rhodoluna sp.]|uniref:DMT family transporter n=1 Tax=Rhodoluna sp. TaxID=1969481 RepID=UPI0025F64C2F|nr:DMT family transporter [Rhodoluna sp.]